MARLENRFRLLIAVTLLCTLVLPSHSLAAKKAVGQKRGDAIKTLLLKRQYKTALAKLTAAANSGDKNAQYRLGNLYRMGLGVSSNTSKAQYWYAKAVDGGHTGAARILKRLKVEYPPTSKKLVLRNVPDGPKEYEVSLQHLPKRPATAQTWLELAAVRNLASTIGHLRQVEESEFKKQSANALIAAALAGRPNAVSALLENGASPNVFDAQGKSPTMIAAHSGNLDTLQVLLSATPDLSARDSAGNGALSLSGKACNRQAFENLMQAGAKDGKSNTPVLIDILQRCPDPSAFMKEVYGGVVTAVDKNGRSVIWYAAALGDEALLNQLLTAGADPLLADNQGYLPLHAAAMAAKPQNIRLLLSNSLTPSPVSRSGVTPLMLAALAGCQSCVDLLPHDEEALRLKDASGETALGYSVRGRNQEIAAVLLASGANPNARNNGGDTPSKLASRLGGSISKAFIGLN